jgi:hypothetical protein
MHSLQQRIAVILSLVAHLRELDQLRERVRKAKLSGRRSRRIGRRLSISKEGRQLRPPPGQVH